MAFAPDVNTSISHISLIKSIARLFDPALIPSASKFYNPHQLSFWSSHQCQGSKACQELVSNAIQRHILQPSSWTNLGSLVQHMAEPFVKLTFKPEYVFGENRLLYDNVDSIEILLYEVLTNMTNKFFERDLDIPLHELAMLFSPLDITLERQRAPTQREISSR